MPLPLPSDTRDAGLTAHVPVLLLLFHGTLAATQGISREDSLNLRVPLNTVKIIQPHAYGCIEEDTMLHIPRSSSRDSLAKAMVEDIHPPSH